ncbi:unnamed protein product [Trichogramma brassicae]|uniref:Uncharacterized protein n=1 Tax=Trichogramma brassicae TaxID=86971 RepID=A0A6H5IB68_9HYME|nr:unnamed protein product [Trichogramma brassicae]
MTTQLLAREKFERRSVLDRHEPKTPKLRPTPCIVRTGREVSEKMLLSGVLDITPEHPANLTIACEHRYVAQSTSERI